MTYGGDGGFFECRYELIRCTNVDFPAPAIPIVIITIGFFSSAMACFSRISRNCVGGIKRSNTAGPL